jgi:hypothetical protein
LLNEEYPSHVEIIIYVRIFVFKNAGISPEITNIEEVKIAEYFIKKKHI